MDYGSQKWKRKRAYILRLDKYIDRVAARYGRIESATIVHHIYPAREYPRYQWCDWNMISVSVATHNKLENRVTGGLTEEGIELMKRTKPGVNWRNNEYRTG